MLSSVCGASVCGGCMLSSVCGGCVLSSVCGASVCGGCMLSSVCGGCVLSSVVGAVCCLVCGGAVCCLVCVGGCMLSSVWEAVGAVCCLRIRVYTFMCGCVDLAVCVSNGLHHKHAHILFVLNMWSSQIKLNLYLYTL